jgi:hypothetical protein
VKNSSAKPSNRSHSARGIARQAPESEDTGRGAFGASAAGNPSPPAHVKPAKWTTLPALLRTAPPSRVTRPIHAAQRRAASGATIASRNPGRTSVSGLSSSRTSPLAASAPRLQPAAKPTLASLRISFAAGASSATASAVPSAEALSTTISSSCSPSCSLSGGSERATSSRLS